MNSQNKDEEIRDPKTNGKERKEPWSWPEGMPETMTKCCESMAGGGARSMPSMMTRCCGPMMRACRWFPLIPVVLAGAAFLLGYYLSPATVRVLWLAFSGAVLLMAAIGLIFANAMCRT